MQNHQKILYEYLYMEFHISKRIKKTTFYFILCKLISSVEKLLSITSEVISSPVSETLTILVSKTIFPFLSLTNLSLQNKFLLYSSSILLKSPDFNFSIRFNTSLDRSLASSITS